MRRKGKAKKGAKKKTAVKKVDKKVNKLKKEVERTATKFKTSKMMIRKGLIMPEEYDCVSRWRCSFVLNDSNLVNYTQCSFLVLPVNYTPIGPSAGNVISSQPDSLAYCFSGGQKFSSTIYAYGPPALNAHGHDTLSGIYGEYQPYKSSLTVRALSSTATESIDVIATVIPLWWTGPNVYNTDGYSIAPDAASALVSDTNLMLEGNYTRRKLMTTYEQGRRGVTVRCNHEEIAGISKAEFMNNPAFVYAYNSYQPATTSSGTTTTTANYILPAYQVALVQGIGTTFSGNVNVELILNIHSIYRDMAGRSLAD